VPVKTVGRGNLWAKGRHVPVYIVAYKDLWYIGIRPVENGENRQNGAGVLMLDFWPAINGGDI